MSAEDALLKHHQKLLDREIRSAKRGRKKNQKPEKELEKQILAACEQWGFDLHVVEAKAVYSEKAGRYLRGQTEAGLPDLVGNLEGLSVWIELKAPGRRSTLKEHQRAFLVRKIEAGCFAVCVDSAEGLYDLTRAFLSTRSSDRCQLLLDHLPKKRQGRDQSDDSLGF